MFGSTYMCEKLFLKIKYIYSKSRPKLADVHVKSLLRLTCSNIEADRVKLSRQKQHQKSH